MENGSFSASVDSCSTIRPMQISIPSTSQPSSPRSSALPSPPDSPDSMSSFPSLSSSFFVSSAEASPPPSHADHLRDSTAGLIIPSLVLPEALRQSTVFGKTVGDLHLIILGDRAELLLEDNDDIVHIAEPEELSVSGVRFRFLRVSTDWVERNDAHGLERFEPAHNIEIVEIDHGGSSEDLVELAEQLLTLVCSPFHDMQSILGPSSNRNALLVSNLLTASSSPFYTALIVVTHGLSTQERTLIETVGSHIPTIILPPTAGNHTRQQLPLSSVRPSTPLALRKALFRSPHSLSVIRAEAAERFLSWRELQHSDALPHPPLSSRPALSRKMRSTNSTRRVNARSNQASKSDRGPPAHVSKPEDSLAPTSCVTLDPLHLPSLLAFSISLFTPAVVRVSRANLSGKRLGLVLIGTLCAGIGIGLVLRRDRAAV